MTAKEYLLDIGFDDAHLPELFNDDDKSHYQIAELMENYHQGKVKNLGLFSVSQQRELLKAFQEYYQTGDYNDEYPFDENINRFLKAFNCC